MAKRPSEHTNAQQKFRKQNCRCAICGTTKDTETHHLIDYSFGGSANPENFITLCHKHHVAAHRGEITIIIEQK